MNKDSLVFYISQYKAVKKLNNEQLGALYRAVFESALGNEPELTPDTEIAFNFMMNQLEIDSAKYEEISRKRSEAGKRGGAPKGNNNASKTSKTSKNKQNKLNDNDNDNVNVNDNDNEGESPEQTDDDIRTFGQMDNVRLKGSERAKLKEIYQNSNKLVDKVSVWLRNANNPPDDHFALCIKFANNDNWPKRARSEPKPIEVAPGDMLSPEEQKEAVRILRETINNTF